MALRSNTQHTCKPPNSPSLTPVKQLKWESLLHLCSRLPQSHWYRYRNWRQYQKRMEASVHDVRGRRLPSPTHPHRQQHNQPWCPKGSHQSPQCYLNYNKREHLCYYRDEGIHTLSNHITVLINSSKFTPTNKRNAQNHYATTCSMTPQSQRLDQTTKPAGTHICIPNCML